MESSGTVQADITSLNSIGTNYTSKIDDLSSDWKGKSFNNLNTSSSDVITGYINVVKGQLNSLSSACSLYTNYEHYEGKYNEAVEGYNYAVAHKQDSSGYTNAANFAASKMREIKGQILSALASASSSKLEATALAGVSVPGLSVGTSKTPVVSASNLIQSSSSGYVFPFEKGVSAPVTSSVGNRAAPTAGASTNHKGTDIGVPTGTVVHSISSGVVTNAGRGDASGYGNWVRVQHDDGTVAIYGHLSKSDYYSVGDRVNAGDVIALTGNEGISTGPHLHLQLEDGNGGILNSEYYFQDCWPT